MPVDCVWLTLCKNILGFLTKTSLLNYLLFCLELVVYFNHNIFKAGNMKNENFALMF